MLELHDSYVFIHQQLSMTHYAGYWLIANITCYNYFKITMKRLLIVFILAFFGKVDCQTAINGSTLTTCLAFQSGNCTTCPSNYHIYQNQCFLNILGCQQYSTNSSGSQICSSCNSTISVPNGNGGCTLTIPIQQLANNIYLQSAAANYGDTRFQPISLTQALNDPEFAIANNYMLKGQYKHFISLTAQPIQSVSTFSDSNQNYYKILYSGSGGGLMLCLISIAQSNNALRLSSFVPIGVSNIVSYCDQYSLTIQCLQCQSGYHLQNSICYVNIANCISYSQNICLQCGGFSYLIENRCVTTCSQTADQCQMQFFGDYRFFTSSVITISRSYMLF